MSAPVSFFQAKLNGIGGTRMKPGRFFPANDDDDEMRKQMRLHPWSPGFVDYLSLASNTSTAFSPMDFPVLTRWAKILMILRSAISLAAVAPLAARAVNIL